MTTIWIHSQSKLISDALANLFERAEEFTVHTGVKPSAQADIAIWDLRGLKPPFPLPPGDVPALALFDGSDDDKIIILGTGYKGYLSGEETIDDLKRAIKVVMEGQLWAERSIMSSLVMKSRLANLTTRENEVFGLLVSGLTNKQIAQRLDISEKTVKVHVSGLLDKLGARNRLDLVMHFGNRRPFSDEE
jgi:DNA-binding NarL/FixJ family response regulator